MVKPLSINAGAIVVTDALISHYGQSSTAYHKIRVFIRGIAEDDNINSDPVVPASKMEHGFRNLSLANLMKSFGNLENNVEDVIQIYFNHCTIEMSTGMLSRAMLYLANHGTDPLNGTVYITPQQAKRINALMLTCGHYVASGDFAFHIGLKFVKVFNTALIAFCSTRFKKARCLITVSMISCSVVAAIFCGFSVIIRIISLEQVFSVDLANFCLLYPLLRCLPS